MPIRNQLIRSIPIGKWHTSACTPVSNYAPLYNVKPKGAVEIQGRSELLTNSKLALIYLRKKNGNEL